MSTPLLNNEERDKFLRLLRQPDHTTFAAMLMLTVLQWTVATRQTTFGFGFLCEVLVIGAPVAHGLFMLSLEFANNLCFGHEMLDRWSAIAGSLVTGVPLAELVRHLDAQHRVFHNSAVYRDPEKPTPVEVQHVNGPGMKMLYCALYPVIYALRRHSITMTRYLVWNIGIQAVVNLWILWQYGWLTLLFLVLSVLVGLSPLHPVAAHLLMQHHRLDKSLTPATDHRVMPTYSYYGIMNLFTFNAGYHCERHLQPKVPWSKLPLVRQLCTDLKTPFYTSTVQAIHDFVFSVDIHLDGDVAPSHTGCKCRGGGPGGGGGG